MENIICPNCGAQNHHYGTCDYCGTTIRKPKTTTTKKQNDAESFAQKIAKYQKVEPFEGGVAVVSIGELHGAINEQGDIVVPLSSSDIENNDGRLLIKSVRDTDKVLDAHGNILAEASSIRYIDNGEYRLWSGGKEQILNQKNEHLAVKLPEGIRVSKALGYGCYSVYNVSKIYYEGIALRDRLLLPCHYDIPYQGISHFSFENSHLIVVEDHDNYGDCRYGIFDLKKKQFALPCRYYFGDTGSSIDDRYYKNKLVRVRNGKGNYGVFDVDSQEFVIQPEYKQVVILENKLVKVENSKGNYGVFDVDSQEFVIQPEYKQVVILDNRVCEVTKKGFFGSKTTTIQL